jgi:hypothetical protein
VRTHDLVIPLAEGAAKAIGDDSTRVLQSAVKGAFNLAVLG